jgi:hypothetical protein
MSTSKDKLIKALVLWLKKNELDGDTTFYSKEEWNERGEEYHNDAEFVITTEGGLWFILNYGDSDEFYELVNSFEYIAEQGHTWNIGFYFDPPERSSNYSTYSEKLTDKRWQDKRRYILDRCEGFCEDCGLSKKIEVHHCYYTYGNEPWEYPIDSLRGLCRSCHEKRGKAELLLRAHLASLKTSDLECIIEQIKTDHNRR